jgi:hypothetical protein
MKISTPEQYRAVIQELQTLQNAAQGTSEFKHRQELLTATHDYELSHVVDPNCRPGRPPGSL